MKVINSGNHTLSNADVLDWIKRKRAQHEREDEEDKKKGNPALTRPKNFMTALTRHERELSSPRYPYTRNPSAYAGEHRSASFNRFALAAENALQTGLESEWHDRLCSMTQQQIDKEYAPLQNRKCLTESELLMLFNHAPVCVEMLQPMVDNIEERFTADEQQQLVDVVMATLRGDEAKANPAASNG